MNADINVDEMEHAQQAKKHAVDFDSGSEIFLSFLYLPCSMHY